MRALITNLYWNVRTWIKLKHINIKEMLGYKQTIDDPIKANWVIYRLKNINKRKEVQQQE